MISRAAHEPGVWDAAGIGESEVVVSGGAFDERCSENAGGGVVVVVDFGGGVAREGTQAPLGVLDEAPFERDGRGEKQGLECWAVLLRDSVIQQVWRI
jgi:hypothetical protein